VAFSTTILTECIVAFPQQWLRERSTMLRYTNITRRVVSQQ